MKTNSLFEILVTAEEAGQRLDKFLASLEEISSRNYAKNLIDKNFVTIDGLVAKASAILRTGQKIIIDLPPMESSTLEPYNFPLDIVYEDSDLLVVNKPSGLVVHPAAGHQQDTLVNALLHYTRELSMKNEQRPGIVHRLDKETSGLLVIAKNDFSHEHLATQFKNKTSHRLYLAVVQGLVARTHGICQSYIARHPTDRKRFASIKINNKIVTSAAEDMAAGKWAVTHYQKQAVGSGLSYVQLKLETGRTHQIRVHMSELGHPLVGDTTYGYPRQKLKELNLSRFFLHATELGFVHPKTGLNLHFQVDWPAADLQYIKSLGFKDVLLR